MKPRINLITIPTNDLQKSFAFYKDGLGLTTRGIRMGCEDRARALFNLNNGLKLVLYQRKELVKAADNLHHTINSEGLIISHFADSREEVDNILQRALQAGATPIGEIQDEPWSYAANFADPDGHRWEIIWEA